MAGLPLESSPDSVTVPAAPKLGRPRLFYGWAIVGVLAVTSALTMAMGALNFGLFIKPMGDELGIGRAIFGWAQSSRQVTSALTAPVVGPLIDRGAYEGMERALGEAKAAGATVHGGGRVHDAMADAYYAAPALVEMPAHDGPMLRETFAPILYVVRYASFEDAVAMNNAVGAGLSSSIFTLDMREAEAFLSDTGSDCGIANVNMGPSGAEIGGAFGGEKETGGGRESGSDAWNAYMRRQTNAVNYGRTLPLAQGVRFDVDDGSAPA